MSKVHELSDKSDSLSMALSFEETKFFLIAKLLVLIVTNNREALVPQLLHIADIIWVSFHLVNVLSLFPFYRGGNCTWQGFRNFLGVLFLISKAVISYEVSLLIIPTTRKEEVLVPIHLSADEENNTALNFRQLALYNILHDFARVSMWVPRFQATLSLVSSSNHTKRLESLILSFLVHALILFLFSSLLKMWRVWSVGVMACSYFFLCFCVSPFVPWVELAILYFVSQLHLSLSVSLDFAQQHWCLFLCPCI